MDIADELFEIDQEINKNEHEKIMKIMKFASSSAFFNEKIKVYVELEKTLFEEVDYNNINKNVIKSVSINAEGIANNEIDAESFIKALLKARKHAKKVINKLKEELGLNKKIILKVK